MLRSTNLCSGNRRAVQRHAQARTSRTCANATRRPANAAGPLFLTISTRAKRLHRRRVSPGGSSKTAVVVAAWTVRRADTPLSERLVVWDGDKLCRRRRSAANT